MVLEAVRPSPRILLRDRAFALPVSRPATLRCAALPAPAPALPLARGRGRVGVASERWGEEPGAESRAELARGKGVHGEECAAAPAEQGRPHGGLVVPRRCWRGGWTPRVGLGAGSGTREAAPAGADAVEGCLPVIRETRGASWPRQGKCWRARQVQHVNAALAPRRLLALLARCGGDPGCGGRHAANGLVPARVEHGASVGEQE